MAPAVGARGGGARKSPQVPVLWRESIDGTSAFASRYGAGNCHGYGRDGRIYMVDAKGYPAVYDTEAQALTVGGTPIQGSEGDVGGNLWCHSSGAMFIDAHIGIGGANKYRLYRTTDGRTWTQVLNYADFTASAFGDCTNTADQALKKTELPDGSILIGFYGGGANGTNVNRGMISRDAGLTWAWLTDPQLEKHLRHWHEISVFDPWRQCVWWAGGDHGGVGFETGCPVGATTDVFASMRYIPGSRQATGVIPCPEGVFVCIDDNINYKIEFYSGRTLDQIMSSAAVVVFDPITNQWPGIDATYEPGFSWGGRYDPVTGMVYAAYTGGSTGTPIGFLVGSSRADGTPWKVIDYDRTSSAGSWNTNASATWPNPFDAKWDGWHYHYSSSAGGLNRWRLLLPGTKLYVDAAAGRFDGDGTRSRPLRRVPDTPFPREKRIVLLSDYTEHLYHGSDRSTIERNGFALGAAAGGTLVDSQTMLALGSDAPPSASWTELNSGGAANLTWNAAAPGGGTCILSAIPSTNATYAYARRASLGVTAGVDLWVAFDVYLDEAALAGNVSVAEFKDNIYMQVQSVSASSDRDGVARVHMTAVNGPLSQSMGGDAFSRVEFPLQAWNTVLLRMRWSQATAPYVGQVEWWINGKLAGRAAGVRTAASATLNEVWIGLRNRATASAARNAYYRNFKIQTGGNPLASGNYTFRSGSRCRVLPDGLIF